MEIALRSLLSAGQVPADLEIIYDDLHPLWGGTRIVIEGTGKATRQNWNRGATQPELFETELTRTQFKTCLALLLEIETWKQETPLRLPQPDESKATLTVSMGGQSSHIWEWFNELPHNNRLLQIQHCLIALTTPPNVAEEMATAQAASQTSAVTVTDAQALSHQAREHLEAGHFEAAITIYERVLSLDGLRVNDWVNHGLALWSIHRNEAALESYDRALALDPNHALAWLNRGNALHDLGRPQQEVIACYDRALQIDSHLARAWYNKGDELGRLGRFIEAKACFENAFELGLVEAAAMVNRCNDILINEAYE